MRSLVTLLMIAAATSVHAEPRLPPVFDAKDAARATEFDTRARTNLAPTRIMWTSAEVGNAERLLKSGATGQAELVNRDLAVLKSDASKRGAILLDFGRELHGGIRLVTGMWESKKPVRVRIRFGESVSEAMSDPGGETGATNDHAIRDETHLLPWLGTIEIGSTGFRFVRIDLAEPNAELLLREVTAAFVYRDVEYLGSFHSSDERLNRIWLTGAYTVHLNMQNYLWDGIKRDRLVWVGDLHPEVMTIASVFGQNEVVPKSLDLIRDATPLPEFMNGISSYSMWWIVIHREWYRSYGDLEYLRAQQAYLRGLIRLLISKTRNGREQIDGWRFLDWSTEGNKEAVDAGLQAMMVIALESGAELCDALGDSKTAEDARRVATEARRHAAPKTGNKQATALLSLAELVPAKKASETLARGGVQGYSAFYGYYILQAKAKAGDYLGAMNAIREYWGGMLDLGATTFWEDFNVAWLANAGRIDELPVAGKIDVHATYGEHSYKKLRMSLAHGWASGPTSWLTEHVLGVQVAEPGGKTLRIRPNLGDLTFVEGTYPTPLGVVKLRHERRPDGSVKTDAQAPDGIRLVY